MVMRVYYSFFLVFIFCLESCVSRHSYNPEESVYLAEQMMYEQPERAYSLLAEISEPEKLKPSLRTRWCMTYARLASMMGKEMPYYSQLEDARAWLKAHNGSEEELLAVQLYMGYSYGEDGILPEAEKIFKEVLMEADTGGYHNLAGTASKALALMYGKQQRYEEGKAYLHKALGYFEQGKEQVQYRLALCKLGKFYFYLGDRDSSLLFVRKAESFPDTLREHVKSLICYKAGRIYQALKLDSIAEQRFVQAMSLDSTCIDKVFPHWASSHLKPGNSEFEKSLHEKYIASRKSEETDYPYEEIGQENDVFENGYIWEHGSPGLPFSYYAIGIAGAVLMVLTFCLYSVRLKRKKKRYAVIEELSEDKELIPEKATDAVTEIAHPEKLPFTFLSRKIEEARNFVPGKGLLGELTEQDWLHAESEINEIYPLFTEKIKALFPDLTGKDIHCCLLALYDLDIKTEALLLNISQDSVSKYRLRVRQKLGIVGQGKKLGEHLTTLFQSV